MKSFCFKIESGTLILCLSWFMIPNWWYDSYYTSTGPICLFDVELMRKHTLYIMSFIKRWITWLERKLSSESIPGLCSIKVSLEGLSVVDPEDKILIVLLLFRELGKPNINLDTFISCRWVHHHASVFLCRYGYANSL